MIAALARDAQQGSQMFQEPCTTLQSEVATLEQVAQRQLGMVTQGVRVLQDRLTHEQDERLIDLESKTEREADALRRDRDLLQQQVDQERNRRRDKEMKILALQRQLDTVQRELEGFRIDCLQLQRQSAAERQLELTEAKVFMAGSAELLRRLTAEERACEEERAAAADLEL